jgi:hypothetical protein
MAERMKQINANAADQMSARARAALIERGRLAAAAAESGLGDNGRIMSESLFNESADIAHLEANNSANLKQAGLDAQGYAAQSQSRLNTTVRPSLVTTGLQIASEGATAWDKTHPYDPKKPGGSGSSDSSADSGSNYSNQG